MTASFLQSEKWMEFQRSLGRKVFDIEGAKVFKHELPFGKSYLYIPRGPSVASFQFSGELKRIADVERAIFAKAEPEDDAIAQELIKLGFHHSVKTIQPNRTVVLDLTRSEDELLSSMHHKTRYNIGVAEKNGIVVEESDDMNIFWDLMKKTTARDRFSSHPREYYEKLLGLCKLHVAWKDKTPLAAAMVMIHGNSAYYLHGASDYEYRNLMAPYLLHWEIAKSYKLKAISYYDLWGIDTNRWPGVSRFKLGWGGRQIEYPGAFDLVISKPWCIVYRITQSFKK